jgi:hypothetical protein
VDTNGDDGEAILEAEYASAPRTQCSHRHRKLQNQSRGLLTAIQNLVNAANSPRSSASAMAGAKPSTAPLTMLHTDSIYQRGRRRRFDKERHSLEEHEWRPCHWLMNGFQVLGNMVLGNMDGMGHC